VLVVEVSGFSIATIIATGSVYGLSVVRLLDLSKAERSIIKLTAISLLHVLPQVQQVA
jgi:hypothetical protein